MAWKVTAISDLDDSKNNWAIVARVSRLWYVHAADRAKSITSIDMILAGLEGVEIHANVRKLFVKKFEHVLKEGSVYSFRNFTCNTNDGDYRLTKHAYKVNIQGNTKVSLMSGNMVPLPANMFTRFDEICSGLLDTSYLIGVLTGVGIERTVKSSGRSTKMNVIELENSGVRLTCALWGVYADEVKKILLANNSGITVLSLFGVKIKEFQGKPGLQNSLHATRIVVNPEIAEAAELKARFLQGGAQSTGSVIYLTNTGMATLAEDFLGATPKKTISQLNNLVGGTLDSCVIVLGTIDNLVGDDWWYLSCKCHRVVYPDSVAYYCNHCEKRVLSVTARYRIKVTVADDTAAATFVIFDRAASALFNKDCTDMIQQFERAVGDQQFPDEISGLVGEEFLFKIEIKDEPSGMYEQSYRVKRLTKDADTINNFKNMHMDNHLQPGSSSVGSSRTSSHAAHLLELEADCPPNSLSGYCNLGTVGDLEHLDPDLLTAGGEAAPLKTPGDKGKATPSKRNLVDLVEEGPNENYSSKLLRTIKIEKP